MDIIYNLDCGAEAYEAREMDTSVGILCDVWFVPAVFVQRPILEQRSTCQPDSGVINV